ncbi:MAG TPA: STAS domain-containing protein, partial [Solirubrobacteraceae bacterium]|nr:STAS domain-containing protein [Solirubrobacteraceae bacterium]
MDAPELDTSPDFELTTEREGDEHRVRLRGELDLAVAHTVEQELSRAVLAESEVVLDLSELT